MSNIDIDNLVFPKPEPVKFDQEIFRKCKLECETKEHITWRVEKEHYDNFNSITKEERQNILKEFRTGITIGEVGEKLNIDSRIVADVILLNIQENQYLTLRDDTL